MEFTAKDFYEIIGKKETQIQALSTQIIEHQKRAIDLQGKIKSLEEEIAELKKPKGKK